MDKAAPFIIRVVDAENGWPVPLVLLTAMNGRTWATDNAGVAVLDDALDLMGHNVWLYVSSDNYSVEKDGFGFEGIRVIPKHGDEHIVKIHRTGIARRVGRVTGAGLVHAAQRAGEQLHWEDKGFIVGCDSVQCTNFPLDAHCKGSSSRCITSQHQHIHRKDHTSHFTYHTSQDQHIHRKEKEQQKEKEEEKKETEVSVRMRQSLYVWGDTWIFDYPLGVFNCSAALLTLPKLDDLVPPLLLPFEYFLRDENKNNEDEEVHQKQQVIRGMVDVPGPGPTWIFGLVTLPDTSTGKMRIGAYYRKIEKLLVTYESGLVVWDPDQQTFVKYRVLWRRDEGTDSPPETAPEYHVAKYDDKNECDGTTNCTSAIDTKISKGGEEEEEGRKQRCNGRWLFFGNPFPVMRCAETFEAWSDPSQWESLESQATVLSVDGDAVSPHAGSIAFNAFRNRWVSIFQERDGKPSKLGQIWYAEADHPVGPWGPCIKVLSHQHHTFYNPRIHPEWTEDDPLCPFLYFEGTFTVTFTDDAEKVPRYEYNQILYRIDLREESVKRCFLEKEKL